MTDFADVPLANALYSERMLVDSAIVTLDGGGNMTFFTIEQAPLPPGTIATVHAIGPVRVSIPPPTPQEVADTLRAWLVQRQADLDAQLAALGVTDPLTRRV